LKGVGQAEDCFYTLTAAANTPAMPINVCYGVTELSAP